MAPAYRYNSIKGTHLVSAYRYDTIKGTHLVSAYRYSAIVSRLSLVLVLDEGTEYDSGIAHCAGFGNQIFHDLPTQHQAGCCRNKRITGRYCPLRVGLQ